MIKKIALSVLFLILSVLPSLSMGVGPWASREPDKPDLIIQDFENIEISADKSWWTFGSAKIEASNNPERMGKGLLINGSASSWFVGGVGVYLATPGRDFSKMSSVEFDLYNSNSKGGNLKVELYEDDNNNWQIEQDPKSYEPLFDDKFSSTINLDWTGWRRISIPFSEFKDVNPRIGDDIWNPNISGNSGGLIQMQFVAVAGSKTGNVDITIDDLGFGAKDDEAN